MTMVLRWASVASAVVVLLMLPLQRAQAAGCSRDDVEFYLGKGFTPEQITVLCAQAPGGEPQTMPAAAQATPAIADVSATGGDTEYLKVAIDGDNVAISEGWLSYEHRPCFDYGQKSVQGKHFRSCPRLAWRIALSGLKILDFSRRVAFIGENSIMVEGEVAYRIVNLTELGTVEQKAVRREFGAGGKAAIPIRAGMDVERAVAALRSLTGS